MLNITIILLPYCSFYWRNPDLAFCPLLIHQNGNVYNLEFNLNIAIDYIFINLCVIYRERNTRLVHIPTNWKSQETGIYEIYLTLRNIDYIKSKLIVIPYGDKLILNLLSCAGERKVYSMVIQTLKYVNPYTNNLYFRYMNLKEISPR